MHDDLVDAWAVAHGHADPRRLAILGSDAIVASLRSRGVEVGYRVSDDEGHLASHPENLVDWFTTVDRFFAEHLGGASGAA